MMIVKYLLGPRSTVVGRVDYTVLREYENYYLLYGEDGVYTLPKSLLEDRDVKPNTDSFYVVEDNEDGNKNPKYELGMKAIKALEDQIKLTNRALKEVEACEQKLLQQKLNLKTATDHSIECLKNLYDIYNLNKSKEDSLGGKKDN